MTQSTSELGQTKQIKKDEARVSKTNPGSQHVKGWLMSIQIKLRD